tara:strand:- start:217 stop:444 length:228 start_codon:yes stop_codon:yes gene_type:complete
MADKTESQINTVADYIRNTLFSSEVSALSSTEFISVSADYQGKIILDTNVEGLDLNAKFTTAKDGGDSKLTGWSI